MRNSDLTKIPNALDQIEAATQALSAEVIGHHRELRLTSHFQPIFSLVHKRPVGYEALLRAQDPTGKNIPPLAIFNRVRDEEEIVFLDRLCRNLHLRNFLPTADDNSWIFLNVNPQVTVGGRRYGPYFGDLLERYQIPPYRIVIEILESNIHDESLLAEAVNYYKDLGCLIAIDDFGAGHSNFDRIWRLSPQIVKLDRSMMLQAANNISVKRVLPNLVSLLHESGSLVLMEGIETEHEALIAMDSGIDFVQGYYFGKPEKSLLCTEHEAELLPNLCESFKNFTRQNTEKYHNELRDYVGRFQQTARLIENGATAEHACFELLKQPKAERCYLLNHEGRQLGSNLASPLRKTWNDPRFNPLADARDAIWSRRPYFRRAIGNPGEVQISRPYLSIAGANMCVTLSLMINTGPSIQVLCCDLDWNEAM
ncbi:MAG TPA: EAL domain-containing protein [Gallionellaceae bacterium]|nr:EAL domain-containing protein [Gallionellaceae bacterium]